jgi:hypothetical protein
MRAFLLRKIHKRSLLDFFAFYRKLRALGNGRAASLPQRGWEELGEQTRDSIRSHLQAAKAQSRSPDAITLAA